MKKRCKLVQNEKEQQSNGTEDEAVKTMSPITEGITGIREEVNNECDIAGAQRETGPQQEKRESKARQRWRGACKLALHELHSDAGVLHKKSDKGASGALHSHLGPIPEKPSEQDVPEIFSDSEAEQKGKQAAFKVDFLASLQKGKHGWNKDDVWLKALLWPVPALSWLQNGKHGGKEI